MAVEIEEDSIRVVVLVSWSRVTSWPLLSSIGLNCDLAACDLVKMVLLTSLKLQSAGQKC